VLRLTAACLIVSLLVGCQRVPQAPKFRTPYQAVLLDNGQLLFGRFQEHGTDYAMLGDVFYVQNHVDRETGKVSSTLIRRGQESHKPDAMYINMRCIAPGFLDTSGGCHGMDPATIVDPGACDRVS
jgi:hypothetical protein